MPMNQKGEKMIKSQISILVLFLALTACVSSQKYNELENNHNRSQQELATTKSKVEELETLVAELERKLGKASTNQKSLTQSIGHMKDALREATLRKQEIDKRMKEYRKLIQRFKSLTDAGELSIKIIDGRMVVVMPSDVLFASGSSRLSKKGKGTIKKVAEVLTSIPEKKYQIEGHTDNVPIRSKVFPSNWELASARATNVLKTMIKSGLPAQRISAASFAETKPLKPNDTKGGKQANRRIEVVVVPDLSLLPGYE